jgi:hypothetical protein
MTLRNYYEPLSQCISFPLFFTFGIIFVTIGFGLIFMGMTWKAVICGVILVVLGFAMLIKRV